MKLSEQEFLTLINRHKGILYKVSRMYFDNLDDQQDLFQEIILQLWKSQESFKGNSQFSSWMYRVALNTAIVFYKKEKRKPDKFSSIKIEPFAHDGYNGEKDLQLMHFYKAVKELNKIEKALIFQFIEGLSGKEIAENIGLSEVNVRVKTNRTKSKLQEIIKRQGYEF
ncbi:DNA-directed RNA polymerase sigma-70 factor [Salinimicrobium marinum]|uniref:DNA-directed RNA polymerase sigma-70 factor n=1 Tax=Salinimicrobium marinum TaxID=680283 RepID=A0A918SJF3_9FLAO|nr:RNA polymerase sigma factor [Salinimicrobium marinum]GHA48526.1 DNA-directed RNA polymerase sigma-70 factor [Salinimicrobium marinum]